MGTHAIDEISTFSITFSRKMKKEKENENVEKYSKMSHFECGTKNSCCVIWLFFSCVNYQFSISIL